MTNLEVSQRLADELPAKVVGMCEKRALIVRRIEELKRLGVVDAKPHYRPGRSKGDYLWLIHPTAPDGSRQREYIGCEPDKVKSALDKAKRGTNLKKLESELLELDMTANQLRLKLQAVYLLFR